MGLALAVLVFAGALPAMAQSCKGWENKDNAYWYKITIEKIESCLKKGADIKARSTNKYRPVYGYTPLHRASSNNVNPEVIRALINAGADINAQSEVGETPIHLAALNENHRVIDVFVQAGVDINVLSKNGWTPLHSASARNTNPNMIIALVEAGANINTQSKEGFTPLHNAVKSNRFAVLTLLKLGADGKIKNGNGETAFDIFKNATLGVKHFKDPLQWELYWALSETRF